MAIAATVTGEYALTPEKDAPMFRMLGRLMWIAVGAVGLKAYEESQRQKGGGSTGGNRGGSRGKRSGSSSGSSS